jgi:3-phenylpropionate/cinnamic acid dioxygenase small subunit
MTNALLSRSAVEEFLYHEAELLDTWRLPEWSELFTDDARYDIASLDSEDPSTPILRLRCSCSATTSCAS